MFGILDTINQNPIAAVNSKQRESTGRRRRLRRRNLHGRRLGNSPVWFGLAPEWDSPCVVTGKTVERLVLWSIIVLDLARGRFIQGLCGQSNFQQILIVDSQTMFLMISY